MRYTWRSRRTAIDDLAAGAELTETELAIPSGGRAATGGRLAGAHLALAAGRPGMMTSMGTVVTGGPGSGLMDPVED